jgi:outer membrane protein assembly factor BamB
MTRIVTRKLPAVPDRSRFLWVFRFRISTAMIVTVMVAINIPAIRSAERSAAIPSTEAAAVSATPSRDTGWPSFRGPDGMGIANAKLPVSWKENENIAWKTKLPGPGASSPVVWGEQIYVTCYTGYFVPGEPGGSLEDLKRHLIALKRVDGQILWDRPLAAKLPEEKQIRDHGFAASTPAADSERVYVFFGKSGVFAFNHAGEQLWEANVGEQTHNWGSASSPVLYKDLVFINASVESASLVALDRVTGKEKWRATGITASWNTPILVKAESGREELIVAIQGKLLAFNPDQGTPLWSCDTDITWYMVPSMVAANGVVYCLGGRSGVASLAVKAGGSGDVTDTHRLWTSKNGSNVSSPVYHDGYLYWAHDNRGEAFCAKADSGEVVYQKRINRAGQFYASSLLADGKVYHLTRDGRTIVVAARPEYEELAVNDLRDGSLFNGSPAADGNRLLIRSDNFLYCVEQK